ncbi:MAG: hypothetical protein AAFV25_15115 [Bacteroidota bacterium]
MKRNQIPPNRRERIRYKVKVEDDNSLEMVASFVSFQNQGNSWVKINDHWILAPLEHKSFGASLNRFITHNFTIEFIPVASPRAADNRRIFSGNRLLVETIEPEKL